MMKPVSAGLCAALIALSGCGVDGEPTAPPPKAETQPKSGISLSGDARVGISVTRAAAPVWAQ